MVDLNLIIAIAGIVLSVIVTILITRYQVKKNIELAIQTGALYKPKLEILFNNMVMPAEFQSFLIYGIPKANLPNIFNFQIELFNNGKMTIDEQILSIVIKNKFTVVNKEKQKQINFSTQIAERLVQHFSDETIITYKFNSIHPSVQIVISELINFKIEAIEDIKKENLIKLNNIRLFIEYFDKLDGDIRIITYGKNQNVWTSHFRVFATHSESLNELKEKLDESDAIKMFGFPKYKFLIQTNVKVKMVNKIQDSYEFGIEELYLTD